MRRFLVLRTCADIDFRIMGRVEAPNESDAYQVAKDAGLISRRGSHLVLQDEEGFDHERRTYKIVGDTIVFLLVRDGVSGPDRQGRSGFRKSA